MFRSWWSGVGSWWSNDRPVQQEESRFVPFDLTPLRAGARPSIPPPGVAGAASAPATLAELGVPAELALDLESAFRVMGATEDSQVVGYRFSTPDGASRPIRLDDAA